MDNWDIYRFVNAKKSESSLTSLVERTVTDLYNNTAKSVGNFAFYNCITLETVKFTEAESIGNYAFRGSTSLITAVFPKVTAIANNAFNMCAALTALVLGGTQVASLNGSSALTDTAIASGTGYIYVPDSLVNDYKAAVNWKTYASQIRPLSAYEEV